MSRRVFTLLLLPTLVCLGWFMYEQAPNWFPSAPAWLRATSDEAIPGACEAMASLRAFGGSFVSDTSILSADEARSSAAAAVEQTYDMAAGEYAVEQPPALVRARFGDAGERLAWLAVATLDGGGDARLGKAAILYLDAETGEPLEVVTAVSVTDPRAACGGPPVSRRVLVRQYLPLMALTAYGLIVLTGLAISALRRRQLRAQKV